MTSKLNTLIDYGIAAQQSGRLDEALSYYRSAQKLSPGDAEVQSLLGLALTLKDDFGEAEPLLRDAIAKEPDQPGFHMNLAEYLTRRGRYDEARQEIRQLVNTDPAFSPGWEKLGDIAVRQDAKQEAIEYYDKAVATAPGNISAGMKLAELHIAMNEADRALQLLARYIGSNSANAEVFQLACTALTMTGNWPQLEETARAWTLGAPGDPVAWQMLSRAFMEQGRFRIAEECYRKVLSIREENADDLSIYGQICTQCLEFDKANEILDRAVALYPDRPDILVSKGLLHTYFGNFAEAERCCRYALQIDPEFVPAYTQLSHLTRGNFDDSELENLRQLKSESKQPLELRISAGFSLGRVYESRKLYEAAFQEFCTANRMAQDLGRSLNIGYDEDSSTEKTRLIINLYHPGILQQSLDDARPCPVFIVGMPRSGTTLVEGLIAAHTKVFAGGERPLLPQIASAVLTFSRQNPGCLPPREKLQEWVKVYLSDLPDTGTAEYFTDKNPLNIEAAGLIALLFPNSAVIHIRRNPVETCFSIYKHEFSRFWPFAHALSDIAHYYGQYAQLVSHWERVLGERFLTIQYEELVSDFSASAPLLLEHCNLPWEPRCLDFQQENRAIPTLSSIQVREPVKKRQASAVNFQDFIRPLLDGLTTARVDLETGRYLKPD